ncbi:hypothetical protein [Streptomyces sp. NPDC001089]
MVPYLLTAIAAAEEGGGPDIGKMLGQLLQYGVVGLIVVLLIIGIIVPKYVMTNLTADRDEWRDSFKRERENRELTQQQLAKAEERGDLATEQAKTLIRLLEELGHRPDDPARSA